MTNRSKWDFIQPINKQDSLVNHHHNHSKWKGAVCTSDARVKLETFEEVYFIQWIYSALNLIQYFLFL